MAPVVRKQLLYDAWSEFVNFSQHTVAAKGKSGSKNKSSPLWESQFTNAWNPYEAGQEEIVLFLNLHKSHLNTDQTDLNVRTEALQKYLPDLHFGDDWESFLTSQKFPQPLVVMMRKSSIKHNAEWNEFVKYCIRIAKVDPFLAEPKHFRDFILKLFFNWKATDSILKPFPNFYQENIKHLISVLEFYLKSAYDQKPLDQSDEVKDILDIAECLDEHLDELIGEYDADSQDLLERLTPPHWYWHFKKRNQKKDFWQNKLVKRILDDVQNKILTENDAAWQLGVTPDMVACAMQRGKIQNDPLNDEDLSFTLKQYLKMKPGKEEDFWKEESTLAVMEDVRNRVVTLDNAAFQLGVTSAKVANNVGEIKTNAEAELTKRFQKRCSIASPRASSPRSPRLKMIADRKEMERETGGLQNGSRIERQSPAWVGQLTPEAKNPDSKHHSRKLSDDEMRSILHVPKMTVPTNELIANNLDYRKGERFMERLSAEVEDLDEEERLRDSGMWKGMKSVGESNVSTQELVSLDMSGDIVAFGDRTGGVGFWLGDKSLVYRPHNLAVCRTVFVGSGADTKLVSASHDGTVRVLDFEKQEFEMMFSWHKHSNSSSRDGVVWIEPVDRNSWLINCEEGDVLMVDQRDQSVNRLLKLEEARRSTYLDCVMSSLTGSNISVHPVNKNIFSVCDVETVDIYDIRNVRERVAFVDHPNPPSSRMHGSTQFDALNYHGGSGWSNSGAHFMTCPRLKAMQGTINIRPATDLSSGMVTEWPGDKHQSVTGVNLTMCQGATWCPWDENVFFASVNKKSGKLGSKWGLVGVDVESGETVMDLNLSSPVNLIGVHPSRAQIVVANSSGPGVIQIFNSSISSSVGGNGETELEKNMGALALSEKTKKKGADEKKTMEEEARIARTAEKEKKAIEQERKKREKERKKEEAKKKEEEKKKEELREAKRIAREKEELEKIQSREAEKEKLLSTPTNLTNSTANETPSNNIEAEAENPKEKVRSMIYSTPTKLTNLYPPSQTPTNNTQEAGPSSYEMTPHHLELSPQPLENEDNYNIDDICSEDGTDDEEAPRKEIAKWADGIFLRTALLKQCYVCPDLDEIFDPVDMPDLSDIFSQPRERFSKRGSSGTWETPPPSSYKLKEQWAGGHFERMLFLLGKGAD